MAKLSRLLLWVFLPGALLLGGCDSMPVKGLQKIFQEAVGQAEAPSGGHAQLQLGIKRYEDGKYSEAAARLQGALAEGLTQAEEVTARKYLAFIHCASKRERQCRTEFRKALALDPGFQLEAAEAGHPIWGPVFRNVKERG